jgi:tRNA(Ile)-lysidine synthase
VNATFTTSALDHLFAGLTRSFAIAVSGGADSTALMHLIAAWRRDGAGAHLSPPLVLTVDHGLRSASASEAEFVSAQARLLGLHHETLHWRGPKPSSGLQDAARQARYDLMLEYLALQDPPRDLVLAHILEDQAETLLMRLARGSGVDGLSAMRPRERRVVVALGHPVREIPIILHRPLLDTPKAHLLAYLQDQGLPWCEDPSNTDTRFERVRVRQAAPSLAALGLTPESLSRSARRLRAERSVLRARSRTMAAQCVDDHGGAYGELALAAGQDWLAPDLVRLMTPLVEVFGGASPPPQLSQIETLADRLTTMSAHAAGRLTLGGCLVEISDHPLGRQICVFREYARGDLAHVRVEPGQGIFWDRRFYISVAPRAVRAVEIGPVGDPNSVRSDAKLPRHSRAGLPAAVLPPGDRHCLFPTAGDAEVACLWPLQHERRVRWRDD